MTDIRDKYKPGPTWPMGKDLDRARRDCRLESDGSVLLTPLPGGGYYLQATASGGGVPVKITGVHPDSPTGESDVRIFQGDAYAKGTEADASKTGVTIRIMGLAANIASYPTMPQIATPISQTWTKADGTTVTEIVYEVAQWVWWT